MVEWCAAATAAFVLLNKVSSPQYILWLVPFLALLACSQCGGAAIGGRTRSLRRTVRSRVFPLGTHTADRLVHTAVIVQAILIVGYVAAILIQRRNGVPWATPTGTRSRRPALIDAYIDRYGAPR